MTEKMKLEAQAARLEAEAAYSEQCQAMMERTTRTTGGKMGHLNAPHSYAAHGMIVVQKRQLAAELRALADTLEA